MNEFADKAKSAVNKSVVGVKQQSEIRRLELTAIGRR